MHRALYNMAWLKVALRPEGPLLIKSGDVSVDPSLPDMRFVRTPLAGKGESLYIPGSSLKGVLRSFVESVLRTYDDRRSWKWACPTFPSYKSSCSRRTDDERQSSAVYRQSCGACRLFGHTRLRGRLGVSDSLPVDEVRTEVRYGVAVSRMTQAAHDPFEMEVVVGGSFEGHLVLENYEIHQLGLVCLALEAMNQGALRVGFGKNRGLGEVRVAVREVYVEEITRDFNPSVLRGLASFVDPDTRKAYGLDEVQGIEKLPAPIRVDRKGLFTRRTYQEAAWTQVSQRAMEELGT